MTRSEWHALVSGWGGVMLWKTVDPEEFRVGDFVAVGRLANEGPRPRAGLYKVGMGFVVPVRIASACLRAFGALRSIRLRG